jgi:hypothetical protein
MTLKAQGWKGTPGETACREWKFKWKRSLGSGRYGEEKWLVKCLLS